MVQVERDEEREHRITDEALQALEEALREWFERNGCGKHATAIGVEPRDGTIIGEPESNVT
jgi:hypothetical protein